MTQPVDMKALREDIVAQLEDVNWDGVALSVEEGRAVLAALAAAQELVDDAESWAGRLPTVAAVARLRAALEGRT